MPADWFCEINGEKHGPITAGDLKKLADSGKLQPSHPVWRQGMQKKVLAQSVKGLFDDGAAAAARQLAAVTATDELPELEMVAPEKAKEELPEFDLVEPASGDAEVLETLEEEPEKPKKKKEEPKEEEEAPPEIVAEANIVYREGHPDLKGPITGKLTVETTGLRFQFEDDDEFRISFKKVENVLEPVKGDFPPAMKKKALAGKLGGKAGKLAAGMLGRWMGGDAGKLVEKVGGAAGDMAEKGGTLGKPPRNRIGVFCRISKERCKIVFDASGDDGPEMTEEAKILYKQIQKARNKFSKSEEGDININVVINEAGGKEGGGEKAEAEEGGAAHAGAAHAASPTAGKPFRVMIGSSIRGPYSLAEIRSMMSAGKLSGALIGVETWLPAATLGGMLGGSAAAGAQAGAAAHGGGEEDEEVEDLEEQDEEFGDFEEVEEEEEEQVSSPASDDGALPVDDEFNIG